MRGEHEWFRPTSGRVPGVLGLLVAAGMLVLSVRDRQADYAGPLAAGALFLAALVWAALLRPRIALTPSTLVLRNMLETVQVPLAAVEQLVVRQVLAVRVGERRFVSPALGKSLRRMVRGSFAGDPAGAPQPLHAMSYADFVLARIQQRCDDARAGLGIRRGSEEQRALAGQVERRPAVPEITALAVSGLAFLVTLLG